MRTLLSLGSLSTLSTAPIANGGTDATDAATARTNLGAQASNAALGQIAGLTPADGDFLERISGAWVNRTAAKVKQDLGIGYVVCKSAVASSITGTTSETTLGTCNIPANSMGPNSQIEIISLWSNTNSANNKTMKAKLGGSTLAPAVPTTTASLQSYVRVANRNATNSEVSNPSASLSGFSTSTSTVTTISIDTTAATTVSFTGQLATSSETTTLESYLVRITHGR